MTYPYGMYGAPSVGNGLGGLPRRSTAVAAEEVAGPQAYIKSMGYAANRALTYAGGLLSETVYYQLNSTTSVNNVTASWATYPFASASNGSLVRIPTTNFVVQFGSAVRLFTISSETSSAISLTYIRDVGDFYSINKNAKVLYYKFLSPTLVHLVLKYTTYEVKVYTISLQESDITVLSEYTLNAATSNYFQLFPLYSSSKTNFVVVWGNNIDMVLRFYSIDSVGSVNLYTQGLGDLNGIGIQKWSDFGVGIKGYMYTYNEGSNTVSQVAYTESYSISTTSVYTYAYASDNYVVMGDSGTQSGVVVKSTASDYDINRIMYMLGTTAHNSISDAYGKVVLLIPGTATSGFQYEGRALEIVNNS